MFSNFLKNNKNIYFVKIVRNIIFNDAIKLFIFFCYFNLSNIFEKKSFEKSLKYNFDNYLIKTLSKKSFSIKTIYNLSIVKLEILRKYINKSLTKDFIESFKFPTRFPILFVKKSNNILRFCVNYRDLSVIKIKKYYFFSHKQKSQ